MVSELHFLTAEPEALYHLLEFARLVCSLVQDTLKILNEAVVFKQFLSRGPIGRDEIDQRRSGVFEEFGDLL